MSGHQLPHFATLEADVTFRFERRSGPGGQHRNKVETAVTVEHLPTGLKAQASERRSQIANRKVALARLRLLLALEIRQPIVFPFSPSEIWRSRCRSGRLSISDQHADFPLLLAEALDVLLAGELDLPEAARQLGCTSSQLIKLLQREPRALAKVNARREGEGKRPLREK